MLYCGSSLLNSAIYIVNAYDDVRTSALSTGLEFLDCCMSDNRQIIRKNPDFCGHDAIY